MRDTTYKFIERVAPLVGGAVVLGGIMQFDDRKAQFVVAAVGLLITQAGHWKFGKPTYSVDRRFQSLRREVDHFILLVRRLNAAALGVREVDNAATRQVFDTTQERMRESFDRLALLAGRTDDEISALDVRGAERLTD